ncbi:MarR family winged helix-turn-helix transcriptional regulator [Celerinatantimonas yamalensis]|uniref:MarR family transcriptional regulator n=1 Tax=Celerinatantimonas yamalensis TaxID=559956 RepID=A0ABW9G5F9_9GAMM
MTYFTLDDIVNGSNVTLGHLIHRLNQYKDKLLTQHLAPLDITAQQFKVMLLLYRDKIKVCKDLSQELCIDAGATTRMIDRLEKKGLLIRLRDKQDRRRIQLRLTDQGLDLCQEFPQLIVDALNELTEDLSNDEVHQLEILIQRIVAKNGTL